MKKRLIFGLLLCFFHNISSMENQESKSCSNIQELPNEIQSLIIKRIIEHEIYQWTDIFSFNNKSLKKQIKRICKVSRNFNVLSGEELINYVKRLKDARSVELKRIIKEEYKNLSTEELNKKLIVVLNDTFAVIREKNPDLIKENLEEAVKLIIAGADVNSMYINGNTALLHAAYRGYTKIVQLLIEAEADVNIRDMDGCTAFSLAAYENHIKIVQLLIEAGANPNSQDLDGITALMSTTYKGHTKMTQLLIKAGADLNLQDQDGYTALDLAVRYNRIEIAQLLIKAGCDLNIRDNNGNTA